jgi:hypothetical protein
MGGAFAAATIAVVGGVSELDAGLGSGLFNTSQQIGSALGLPVLVAIATARTEDVLAVDPAARADALTEGFQSAPLTGAGIALLGLIATLLFVRRSDSHAHVTLGREPVGDSAVVSGVGDGLPREIR